jgi:hypothetical protein
VQPFSISHEVGLAIDNRSIPCSISNIIRSLPKTAFLAIGTSILLKQQTTTMMANDTSTELNIDFENLKELIVGR